ncbi:prepilin peptidase [Megamonas hypermegale]|uniref:prepilin peptidase n=1 Tax=Megamonas hypermegale TaxID=158847 RepID=UPI0019569277|nr:prepilin peptidase [Megamonas hypermegale]MBM6760435.1 prepilin peptidase [Megamonas hypermegale]
MLNFIDYLCILLLIYIAIKDITSFIISNKILCVLLVLALIRQVLSVNSINDMKFLLLCSVILLVIFSVLYYVIKNFMGGGDVKLIFVLSIWLGYPQIIIALYIAFIFGGVFAVMYLLIKQRMYTVKIAFAPFLVVGAVVSFFVGSRLYDLWLILI